MNIQRNKSILDAGVVRRCKELLTGTLRVINEDDPRETPVIREDWEAGSCTGGAEGNESMLGRGASNQYIKSECQGMVFQTNLRWMEGEWRVSGMLCLSA